MVDNNQTLAVRERGEHGGLTEVSALDARRAVR